MNHIYDQRWSFIHVHNSLRYAHWLLIELYYRYNSWPWFVRIPWLGIYQSLISRYNLRPDSNSDCWVLIPGESTIEGSDSTNIS